MPVRTARLAAGSTGAASASTVAYVCPAGKTAILKDLRLSIHVAPPVFLVVALHSGPTFVNVLVTSVTEGNGVRSPQVYLVLEPGDELIVQADKAAGVNYWLSGTELEGIAP